MYGCLQHRLTLEYWLEPFIKNKKKVDPWVWELLLLAIYQMQYLDKVPDHAIFNETIEIAKVKGHVGTRKFVTGVLHAIKRNGLRNFDNLTAAQRLSIEESIPQWIIEQLISKVGLEKTVQIAQAVNQTPHDSLRVNIGKIKSSELQVQLEKEGITTSPSEIAADGLVAQRGFLAGTPEFKQGSFIIQDESAMLAVESMDVQPGQSILDACAAPGGKTTQIATALAGQGNVVALDIHQHKLKLIKRNAERLGVANVVHPQLLDARKTGELGNTRFDQILVDAPCSGIGLMRRKPEVRYEKTLKDSQQLAQIQLQILDAVAPTLKSGGKLTYSTCTILPSENQTVVDQFLKKHSDFKQVKTQTKKAVKDQRTALGLTIYPDDFGSDGFFIATLMKK
ncbi:16S rRNA m(5)C 967 methyltransferase [Ligilactobacillus araffinosus DSM 20653]|uniref:16S rRNA (cytosine(967)-C(5))-methyltransferase n=1 Tax=Ligilactobacillus araffinosus DSM 20653 TaxID=1423820 RepID=A0A0R1ZG95_9LACO|nr:16S rRNA m(5)C 967 methyltransferase [Ligilactobacillus araffinosus DSM 20653]